MKVKEYEMFDGRKAVFEYDENGVGKITLECMDMLMGLINNRKTENSSEIPNNCEDEQTEETCERCVYVRGSQWCQGCNGTPKRWDGEKIVDTPQTETQTETQNSNLTFEKADERCKGCNHYKLTCDLFSEICEYEPKDEPQTDMAEDIVRSYGFKAESYQQAKAKDEPQERSE